MWRATWLQAAGRGVLALDCTVLRDGVLVCCCWATDDRNSGAGQPGTSTLTISQTPQV